MRVPWLLIGFFLGVLSQDPGAAAVAHDLGAWTRCAVIECRR
mgnify:CR=1 FL=1